MSTNVGYQESTTYTDRLARNLLILRSTSELSHRLPGERVARAARFLQRARDG